MIFRNDGVMKIDVRLSLESQVGAYIYFSYEGQFVANAEALKALASGAELAPDSYNLTVAAKIETGDASLRWLEDAIIVGVGKQSGYNPTYDFFVIGQEP